MKHLISPFVAERPFHKLSLSKGVTLLAIALYLVVMVSTNRIYTFLDDESTIVAVAGHPVAPTLNLFLHGAGQHEHPPVSDILLHAWLVATGYSFVMLRIFANIFYIAAIWFTAKSAEKIGGRGAYWVTLGLGFTWPFAFQYGRITGWYCVCLFLISLLTWLYLSIIEGGRNYWLWCAFAATGILLVWSNYFGVAILFLLFVDLMLFHRQVAIEKARTLLVVAASIAASLVPLLGIVLLNLKQHAAPVVYSFSWKSLIAIVGYPAFAILGSTAVAPWFLPLSLPVAACAIVLCVSIWFSPGRRWFVYYIVGMVLLELSGHMDVKRVLFLMSWLFVAMGLAATGNSARTSRAALGAAAGLVVLGWIGVVSGNHYATTNLREPWNLVAKTVAGDLKRNGSTVISSNPSFFFYLDYQLGLQSETATAEGDYIGEKLYAAHGYRVLLPHDALPLAATLRGPVVLVMGTGTQADIASMNQLNDMFRHNCKILGEYKAAPDPAVTLKRTFASYAPALDYRTHVIWFGCLGQGDQATIRSGNFPLN